MKLNQQTRTAAAERYEPVREFERQTSYCPFYLAWHVVDETRDYFRTNLIPSSGSAKHKKHLIRPADTFSPSAAEKGNPMGEGQLADKLARRAEVVFAKQPFWRRKFGYRRSQTAATNRDAILIAMRHWLAGELARENPALFNQLPESFKIGKRLPASGLRPPSPIREAKGTPQKSSGGGRKSAPFRQSRFTSAATVSRSASRVRSARPSAKSRFVHGGEWLAI